MESIYLSLYNTGLRNEIKFLVLGIVTYRKKTELIMFEIYLKIKNRAEQFMLLLIFKYAFTNIHLGNNSILFEFG